MLYCILPWPTEQHIRRSSHGVWHFAAVTAVLELLCVVNFHMFYMQINILQFSRIMDSLVGVGLFGSSLQTPSVL